jgi:deoxycytidylate deaminase
MAPRKTIVTSTSPLQALTSPELVFGIVGAVGTDLDDVAAVLSEELSRVRYEAKKIKVSSLMYKIKQYKGLEKRQYGSDFYRVRAHMEAGSAIRERTKRGDFLALLAVAEIRRLRKQVSGDHNVPKEGSRVAYILRSLKHPDEIRTLRNIYGRAFYLVSAYSPRSVRINRLATRIASSSQSADHTGARSKAETLVEIDEKEDRKLGQNVRESFPLADAFVNASSRPSVVAALRRFIELVFSHPFHTPTRDEYAMFHAHAAALRSADLSRQVGAAITTSDGGIIAVGSNDVPRFSGGLYWPEDVDDARDFRLGSDSNVAFRREMVSELVLSLKDQGFFGRKIEMLKPQQIADLLLAHDSFKESIAASVIEFGRSVHAEMAAISDAARRGVSVCGGTLYSTTFPCHLCARHIIASGITRVVYIEPYPKSRAERLFSDSISVDAAEPVIGKVAFAPFVGIAPAIHTEMFKMVGDRKDKNGKAIRWIGERARPRLRRFVPSYITLEQQVIGKVLPEASISARLKLLN